jgi:F-type H+-transporting ATPase subunit a
MLFFSPMEQYEIYSVFSMNLILNQINIYMLIVTLMLVSLAFTTSNSKLITNWWGILNESLYKTILSMVTSYINVKSVIFLPMIYTIFHFILFSNLVGMIPYSSTPTVEIIMTLTLAFTILIGVLIMGFFSHKLYLFAVFLPAGTPLPLIFLMVPLEILAYLTRTLSLGLRLAVNLITGHILGKVLISFIWLAYLNNVSFIILTLPLLLVSLFLSLELLIAYLQAYIFTFITCITIRDII